MARKSAVVFTWGNGSPGTGRSRPAHSGPHRSPGAGSSARFNDGVPLRPNPAPMTFSVLPPPPLQTLAKKVGRSVARIMAKPTAARLARRARRVKARRSAGHRLEGYGTYRRRHV